MGDRDGDATAAAPAAGANDAVAPSEAPDSVETWLRREFFECRALPEAGLIHRLDFLTSGCLLAARNIRIYGRLRAAMRAEDGGVEKVYLVAVAGTPCPQGRFEFFFSSRHKRSRKITVRPRGRPDERGTCEWRVVRQFEHDKEPLSLLEVRLLGPGRRHQIRAGFAHLGHPLLGDALYGGPPWDRGFGLHAWRLTVDGVKVECPPPKAWGVA